MSTDSVTVFYSYSHVDEEHRRNLITHLSLLKRKGIISEWHDRKIIPGKEWGSEIDENLDKADLIILLISPDFIASDYCWGVELDRAMELHESQRAIVVPVIIRPTDWSDAPFAKLQSLPEDAKPITTWNNMDEAWLNVVKGLRNTIDHILERKRSHTATGGLISIKSLLSVEVERIDSFIQQEKSINGLSTGLADLDELLDGLHRPDLITVAGRPQVGKTDFVLGIAASVAIKEHIPVAFYSMRVPANRLTRKLTSSVGQIDSFRMLRGFFSDDDWPRLTSAIGVLAGIPLYIDDKLDLSLEEVSESIRAAKDQYGVGLVIIDSIQNLLNVASGLSHSDNTSFLTSKLKILARELNVSIIVTCSLPRDLGKRANKRPLLSDLEKWDPLSESSDVVIFLYRDEMYDELSPDRGTAELIVAKNSNGPVGTVRTTYSPKYSRFENFVIEGWGQVSHRGIGVSATMLDPTPRKNGVRSHIQTCRNVRPDSYALHWPA